MIHPVKKAMNKMVRQQMYGFLNTRQFPQTTGKSDAQTGYSMRRDDRGPAGGAAVPAKPKSPKPTSGRSAARVR